MVPPPIEFVMVVQQLFKLLIAFLFSYAEYSFLQAYEPTLIPSEYLMK
jgi:hypothetical protein